MRKMTPRIIVGPGAGKQPMFQVVGPQEKESYACIVNVYEHWWRKCDLVEYKYTRREKANEESRKSLIDSKVP